MYAFMPPELKLNLFDLNEENDNVEQKDFNFKDMTDIIDNFLLNAASTILPENVLPEEKMNEMFENIMTQVNEERTKTVNRRHPWKKFKKMGRYDLTNQL